MRQQQLATIFVEIADTLVDDFDVIEFLQLLADRSVSVVEVSAAGLLITDQRGALRPYDDPAIGNATGGDGSDIGAFERQPPRLTISDATVTEGNAGTLNSWSLNPLTVTPLSAAARALSACWKSATVSARAPRPRSHAGRHALSAIGRYASHMPSAAMIVPSWSIVARVVVRAAPRATSSRLIASSARRPDDSGGT